MKKDYYLTRKWLGLKTESKIVFAWIPSLIIILILSSIFYYSKLELHSSTDVLNRNNEIRNGIQKVFSSVQALEISNNNYLISNDKSDSLRHTANLETLLNNLSVLESLIKNEPRFLKLFIPIQNIVRQEIETIKHPSVYVKDSRTLNRTVLKNEQRIYRRLDEFVRMLYDEEDNYAAEQMEAVHSKIKNNLNYFLVLIIVYISFLTFLFIVIIRDASEKRKLAAEVTERKIELESIINTAPALIYTKNLEKKFTLLNKSFLEFFKINNEKILYTDRDNSIKREDGWLSNEEDEAVIANKVTLKNIERRVKFADGTNVWLKINKAPLYDGENNLTGIVGVMDDITERVEYQASLIEAQKKLEELNKQKDKFFSIIAHDLKSPFNGLLGLSGILADEYESISDEERISFIKNIQLSLKNLYALIENLLTWARVNLNRTEFDPKEIYLKEIVGLVFDAMGNSASNKKISLISEVDENLKVKADPNMIETVIRNFVSNAIKFTSADGSVKVTAAEDENNVKIEIEDDGVGMSEKVMKGLFKIDAHIISPGTNDEKGTGLGLIICKEFVEKHGGKINVTSEVGKGTIISFTLPIFKTS